MPRPSSKALSAPLEMWHGLREWRWVMLASLVAILLVLATWLISTHTVTRVVEAQRAARAAEVDAVVAGFAAGVRESRAVLAALAREPDLPDLLRAADPERLLAREQSLAAKAERVLRVRLLPLGGETVDYGQRPPFTYAALEMLRRSRQTGTVPPPEVLLHGTEDQHLLLAWRIEDQARTLVGHLVVLAEVALLQDRLDQVPALPGSAQVRQQIGRGPPLVVASRGAKPLLAPLTRELAGTVWQLAYEPSIQDAGDSEEHVRDWVWRAAALGALLVLGATLVTLRRRRPTASPSGIPAKGASGEPEPLRIEAELPPIDIPPDSSGILVEEGASGLPAAEVDADGNGGEWPASVFRAYDIRGVVGRTLTVGLARAIGTSIGSEALERGVQTLVVGRDGRVSSDELAAALVEGLRASGRDVIDLGRVPTPVLYFATEYLETRSGVMVTGSHNPSEYNGFKIVLGGETLDGPAIGALRERLREGRLSTGAGTLQVMDITAEYVRRVTEDIPVALGNAYTLVVDGANGVAGELAPRLYRALGHDVIELFCEVDGTFPNHPPDPTRPENLQALGARVREEGADLGMAFDGDGDRLVLVDETGAIVWPDWLLVLLARGVLRDNPGATVLYDVKCSRQVPAHVERLGGNPLMWKSGHSRMKAKMLETGALLGGEGSGHLYLRDRWSGFDDALYAGARVLEALREGGTGPREAFADLVTGTITPELQVPVQEGEGARLLSRLADGAFPGAGISRLDGLRAEYPDGWGLVRASNTTPALVFRFEADDEAALARIQAVFRSALQALVPTLRLPF